MFNGQKLPYYYIWVIGDIICYFYFYNIVSVEPDSIWHPDLDDLHAKFWNKYQTWQNNFYPSYNLPKLRDVRLFLLPSAPSQEHNECTQVQKK